MLLPIVVLALFTGYAILVLFYWRGWNGLPVFTPTPSTFVTTVSVIIPARNEEQHLGALLESLSKQTYPASLTEIIVVDDHSTDGTSEIAAAFAVRLLRLQEDGINSYKKKAIETGIAIATGQLLVTTDADCNCGPRWLASIVSLYQQEKPAFIAAPVAMDAENNIIALFQALDFAVLQGITGASVHRRLYAMCNGANLAYEKKAFEEVNGFAGIDDIASGDDMLLMHKIWKKYPGRIRYLKSADAVVHTQPMKSWRSFFNQRIRWASKATRYADRRITAVLVLVYTFNLCFPVLLMAGIEQRAYWWYLLVLWIAKTLVEWPLAYALSAFLGKRSWMLFFFFFQPLHIAYTLLSGLWGQWGSYEWKGRRVK